MTCLKSFQDITDSSSKVYIFAFMGKIHYVFRMLSNVSFCLKNYLKSSEWNT